MDVILAVTKTCHHCRFLEKELKRLGVPYRIKYSEDNPEMTKKHSIRRSPVIIVDDKVAFSGMPSVRELEDFFAKRKDA